MYLSKLSDTPVAEKRTTISHYRFQQTNTGAKLWLVLPSSSQHQKELRTIFSKMSVVEEGCSNHDVSYKPFGKKNLFTSWDDLHEKSETNILDSSYAKEKKRRKKKKGDDSIIDSNGSTQMMDMSQDNHMPLSNDIVHTSGEVGGNQMGEPTKKKQNSNLVKNFTQDSESDIFKSQDIRRKKKRKKKKNDEDTADGVVSDENYERPHDNVSDDSIHKPCKRKITFTLGFGSLQDSELGILDSQNSSGKKKRKKKQGSKSNFDSEVQNKFTGISQDDLTPSSPTSVPSSEELGCGSIHKPLNWKMMSTLADDSSLECELNVLDSQCVSGKKKRKKKKRDKDNIDSDAPDVVSQGELIPSSPILEFELGDTECMTPIKKKHAHECPPEEPNQIEYLVASESPSFPLSQQSTESGHLPADDDFQAPRKSKKATKRYSATEEFKRDASLHNSRNKVTAILSPAVNETPHSERLLSTHKNHKKKILKSYSRDDSLDLDECHSPTPRSKRKTVHLDKITTNDDMHDDNEQRAGESTPLQLGQRITDPKDKKSKEYIGVIEELLTEEDFSREEYSEVLDEIKEINTPSDDVLKRLSELNIITDWNIHSTHQVESNIVKLPTENEMIQIKCLNENMKKGRYLPSEDKIIKKNWNKFSKEYSFENPKDFLIVRRNNYYLLSHVEFKKFVCYLGRGLPNRTLNSIYKRFRRIFEKQEPGRLSGEMKNVFERHINLYGKKYSGIKTILNKSTHNLSASAGYIASPLKAKSFKNLQEQTELFKAILEVTHSKSYEDLQGKTIDWKNVGNILNVRSDSCRKYWTRYLSGYMALKEPVPRKVVYAKIIEGLKKMNVECSTEVDWNHLSSDVFGLPSTFLWIAFSKLCQMLKIKYTGDLWREAIEELSVMVDKKIMIKTRQKMFPCCKFENSKIVYYDAKKT